MKKFFKQIKTDIKFARAGEGHKLTEDTRTYQTAGTSQSSGNVRTQPLSSTQIQAGAAAIARLEQKNKQPKTVVPKVIRAKPEPVETQQADEPLKLRVVTPSLENNVMFHSPFTNEVVAKSALKDHIRECLILRLNENAVQASSLMITSLNKDKDKMKTAIETINKYVDNIIVHPDEEKYRKIRQNNRIFLERILPVEGCEEFLEAIGFKRTLNDTDSEIYFVLSDVNVAKLKEDKETLASAQVIEVPIYRDPKIILPSSEKGAQSDLSSDFFKLSSMEVKREHQSRSEEIELNKQLRTKATREASRTIYKYNYALIRVKFPDGRSLQGTFRARESIGDLNAFIREHINVEWAVFGLKTAIGKIVEDEEETFLTANLVPTATLNLIWNEEVRVQVLREQGIELALNSEVSKAVLS
ncbi:UBX domain-containing protein 6-like [Clavelina lepadiformis]|uniref:UBX domain-containing protein n=1 Tax=Clavelina lepadiformis TaxID=159417 RepID=A0ABP0FSE0_CLALP